MKSKLKISLQINWTFIIIFRIFYCEEVSSQQDITEFVIKNTIKIAALRDTIINGKKSQIPITGTGFYFCYTLTKDTIPVVVTNSHVIKNCQIGFLRFKSKSNTGKVNHGDIIPVMIDSFESRWIKHPTEDVAILPLNQISTSILKLTGKIIDIHAYQELNILNDAESNNWKAIENVIMIGYPEGLSDTFNELPIVRQGLTATPIFMDYNNSKRFLLDIPIYPGSSGSPVVLLNIGYFYDKAGTPTYDIHQRIKLLGIAVQSKNYYALGKTKPYSPTPPKDTIPSLDVKTSLPYNVAIVIKASRLLDFKNILSHK
jgi:hypothetical protein